MIKKLSVIFSSSLILALIATSNLLPQKAIQNRDLILNPDVRVESYVKNNIRFDLKTNVPIALYSPNYQVRQASPQQMAEQFLSENSFLLKIQRNLSDLKYNTTTETRSGYHVHFDQYVGDYPVYNSTINVTINKSNRVIFV